MVIDGNMKNHRDVCKAKDAGYMEFEGLPNRIVTGCMNTPDYKSRYCKLHKDRVCTFSVNDQTEDDAEGVIEMILEKKSTRTATHYKVRLYLLYTSISTCLTRRALFGMEDRTLLV